MIEILLKRARQNFVRAGHEHNHTQQEKSRQKRDFFSIVCHFLTLTNEISSLTRLLS